MQEESVQATMATAERIQISHAKTISAEELQRRYFDEIYAYVSRRLPRREDAEDATAETFEAAFAHIRRLRGKDPRLWLLGIARRKVVDQYRRLRKLGEIPLENGDGQSATVGADIEDIQEVRRLVMALPEDQREALLLQYVEGCGQKEIATIMGKSKGAVNSLQQRARANVLRGGKEFFLPEAQP